MNLYYPNIVILIFLLYPQSSVAILKLHVFDVKVNLVAIVLILQNASVSLELGIGAD